MQSFIIVSNKLRHLWWLGFVGFLRFVVDAPNLSHFHLFFLFGIFAFVETSQNNDMRVAFQSLRQLGGMVYAPIAHGFRLPSKDNYICTGNYILPFTGKWVVVNGGIDKELSHSWGIQTQRYAYDFIILDDEGDYSTEDKKSLQSYFCYAKDIIAPADGVVVEIRNHYKDSRVDGENAYCDAPDMRGNFIVIKHSKKEYSTIAHIMPSS